ncbi:hypothetical protein TNCV_335191 [Trichonephila clavipes]|nr:hypothetical protein TNCV_335191 [Trichonephila clavipes]
MWTNNKCFDFGDEDSVIDIEEGKACETVIAKLIHVNLLFNLSKVVWIYRWLFRLFNQNELVIFSDFKSAIETIRNGETNISCDIITLLEQLHSKRKSCILQWLPAHVNIKGKEYADSLAKGARDIDHKCTTITLYDANAVAKHRIINHIFKKTPSYGI